MYDLPYHKARNAQVVETLINQYPFAYLSGCDRHNNPVATQVPVFLETRNGRRFLSGHLMKNTDHHKAFEYNNQVLVVFTGPHTYVSGTWYNDPHSPSTWNYMSVHARGKISFLDGTALEDMLRKTSLHFENNNPHSSTVYDNLPQEFKRSALRMIVAFEIEVDKLDNVFKLSQDRDASSYESIMKHLNEQGEASQQIATEMLNRQKEVFPE